MREINVPKEHDGYIYTIKSLDEDCVMECPKTCQYVKMVSDCTCSHFLELMRNSGYKICGNVINCIRVVFNVKNIGCNEDWYVGAEDAILIDNEGFSYRGTLICENFHGERDSGKGVKMIPGTQVNYVQLFPLLPKEASISSIRVDVHHKVVDFNMSDKKNDIEIMRMEQNPNYELMQEPDYDDIKWDIKSFTRRVDEIRTLIYSYENNILTSSERIKIENKIRTNIYSTNVEIERKKQKPFIDIKNELHIAENMFNNVAKNRNGLLAKNYLIEKKVDDLLNLTPHEFAEYVRQLYISVGYVIDTEHLISYSINISLMLKGSSRYIILCKRCKDSVSSSDVQKLIGFMERYDADRGIFVTTGMFSFEAEKMASEHPIELVNRITLSKLILSALNKD